MKKIIIYIILLVVAGQISFAQQANFTGEEISYKLGVSIFNVGRADFFINDLDSSSNDTYKIIVKGETSGLVGVFSKIKDEWGAHVSKEDYLPTFSYRRIREGNYKRDEDVAFDTDSIALHEWSFSGKKYKDPVVYKKEVPDVYEFLSGLLYVRALNFEGFEYDQRIKFKTFFDGKFYDFEVMYKGKERIRTKFGKKWAIKLVPIMPKNSIFDGENPITMWISDDRYKIPLKVNADFRYVGVASVEITKYKNADFTLRKS